MLVYVFVFSAIVAGMIGASIDTALICITGLTAIALLPRLPDMSRNMREAMLRSAASLVLATVTSLAAFWWGSAMGALLQI